MSTGICKINTNFVKWKALYFLAATSQSPYCYFLVNFYISRGLSYQTAGLIESIVPFVGCIFRPLACYLADRFALHRFLLATSVFIYGLSLSGFLVLSTRFELIVNSGNVSNTNETYQAVNVTQIESESVNRDFVIPVICALRFLATIGITPATSLLDGIIYHSLEASGQSANWGRQRLWGSIGFSSAALLSAFLLDSFEIINFVIGFSMALCGTVAFFIVSVVSVRSYQTVAVERNAPANEQQDELIVDKVEPEKPIIKNHFFHVVGFIFKDGQVLLVLAVACAVGYLTACRDVFGSQYIESITQQSSKKIMGVMQGVIGTLEIPVMFSVGWFFKKIGTMPFFAASFASFALRFYFYTLLTADSAWFFVAIELLHIFGFGFIVPAFTYHAHTRVVKYQKILPEMSTIMQGLVSTVYLGLGYGFGSIAAGSFFHQYGGRYCMLIFSFTGAGCLVVFSIIWIIIALVSRKNSRLRQQAQDTNMQSLNPQQ